MDQLRDGKTWTDFEHIWYSNALLHTDQHCVAINPTNANQGLCGNDGGLCSFTYNPNNNSASFSALNANLCLAQFYGGTFHPINPNILIVGAQDNATAILTGNPTNWTDVIGGDGGHAAIDFNHPNIQYGTYVQFQALDYTTNTWGSDSGSLFDTLDTSQAGTPNWTVPIVLNPLDTTQLYTGGSVLCTYSTGAGSWSYGPDVTNGSILCIAVAPSDGKTIYTGADDGQIWMSQDGGANWTEIDNVGGLPNRVVNSIVVNPTNPNSILVGLSGFGQNGVRLDHVRQCTNTAAAAIKWTSVSTQASGMPDVPVNSIALAPLQPATTFYVGTDT